MTDTLSSGVTDTNQIHSDTAKKQPRGEHGWFVKQVKETVASEVKVNDATGKSLKNVPPLVSLEVSNPIAYLKVWWQKVMSNEGIDFRFRIRPLTAMALVAILAAGGFWLGRWTMPLPVPEQIIKYLPQLAPTPTPNPWKETAYIGSLRKTGERFYLLTEQAEAISLAVPDNVNLTKYLGKRILAVGKYNRSTGILQVMSAEDLEVVIQSAPVPTAVPTLSPTAVPTTTPTKILTEEGDLVDPNL